MLHVLLALALIAPGSPPPPPERRTDLRVMTFNLRYGTARDGSNAWAKRRQAVVEAIEAHAPDLLGTQECLASQRDFLLSELPRFDAVGVGRDDGRERGEMAAIFYDRERFAALADGHLWLSATPDAPGSVGWDAAFPRVASWVLLQDRAAEGRRLLVLNTHFDHRGVKARVESARLLRTQVEALDRGIPVILLGDFNAAERSQVHATLLGGEGSTRPLVDVYRALHPERRDEDGTLSGFGSPPDSWRGLRVDWILATAELVPLEASVDRARYRGRYPSDHYPVRAVLSYRAGPEDGP